MAGGPNARQLALEAFQKAYYPEGLTDNTAWLGIYQVLLWYENVKLEGVNALPHIIDADKLRPPSYRPTKSSPSVWQKRALSVEQYLAHYLHCEPYQVQEYVDQLMKTQFYQGMQRQNPLGIAFPALICNILGKFGNQKVSYDLEVPAQDLFPGIKVPGRSPNPKIDIVIRNNTQLKAIISCKWSLRHDRLNDISNECPVYKNAANITRTKIDYLVITNEFDPARLGKLLDDPCVDALIHVHKALPIDICGFNSRLVNMLDLVDLIDRSQQW